MQQNWTPLSQNTTSKLIKRFANFKSFSTNLWVKVEMQAESMYYLEIEDMENMAKSR